MNNPTGHETLTDEERAAIAYEADYLESAANASSDDFVTGSRKALRIHDAQATRITEQARIIAAQAARIAELEARELSQGFAASRARREPDPTARPSLRVRIELSLWELAITAFELGAGVCDIVRARGIPHNIWKKVP